MKAFALFLLLLFGCLLLANIMVNDTGYVLIAYENMTFESTLWGLCLMILLLVGVVWLVSGLVRMMFGATSFIYPFTAIAKQRHARKLSIRGFAEFTHGHWKKAEKLLVQAAEAGETPLLTYLAAARAAHEAGHHDACSDYLRRADHKAPGADLAIGITQAQIQLSAGQLEQALATIKRLHKKEPRHAFVLKLLKQVYCRLHDWQSLAALLPKLKRLKVIDDNEYRELELQSFEALFEQASNNSRGAMTDDERAKPLQRIWNDLSFAQRKDPVILYRYASSLVQLGLEEKAAPILREHLPRCYSADLILLYGKIRSNDLKRQLLFTESLLKERPNDPDLLLSAGRLALRNELWGKAREYFEASLRFSKRADTYNELGRLLAHLGEHESSNRYFQDGLLLAADTVIDLPDTGKSLQSFNI
ncbi:heme biosynthesis protein HemY [Endozoicomonas gorgoniicola]|uniref:Heme biosynthesis protein HemY n=1 Tax=Endozoicomonas gorgoniicola TaxID=1234144 RepID=A0ABT3N042_9GAMM|nr:heme biosynthesis HemY N-terminal domain-containing protein [Endozoicomonas gorgoniicola]MCW7554990.1 heme biosynthesis protein HemY [Endozoicomonas gorgoniicola]